MTDRRSRRLQFLRGSSHFRQLVAGAGCVPGEACTPSEQIRSCCWAVIASAWPQEDRTLVYMTEFFGWRDRANSSLPLEPITRARALVSLRPEPRAANGTTRTDCDFVCFAARSSLRRRQQTCCKPTVEADTQRIMARPAAPHREPCGSVL